MTEHEWDLCTDLLKMAESLPMEGIERKAQLFACACCRRLGSLLEEYDFRSHLTLAYHHADGLVHDSEIRVAIENLQDLLQSFDEATDEHSTAILYAGLALFHTLAGPFSGIGTALVAERVAWALWNVSGRSEDTLENERAVQRQLLRDIFGNPFRQFHLKNSCCVWKDERVPRLALEVYQKERFQNLHIIADSLEKAGCSDFELLDHLRSKQPHVRGCWGLEAILSQGSSENLLQLSAS